MRKVWNLWSWTVTVCALMWALPARADLLVLKDGRVMEGAFVAGSESFIQFRTGEELLSIPLGEISSLVFKSTGDTMATAMVPDSTPTMPPVVAAPSLAPGALLVPAGTKLRLRIDKELSSDQKPGASFQATLEEDLMVEGKLAAAKGSKVLGRIAEVRGGKKLGTQFLKLSLLSLSVHNQKVPLVTENFGPERATGQPPRLVGAEQATGSDGSKFELEQFADGQNHLKVPQGTVLVVALRESVALFP